MLSAASVDKSGHPFKGEHIVSILRNYFSVIDPLTHSTAKSDLNVENELHFIPCHDTPDTRGPSLRVKDLWPRLCREVEF